MTVKKEKSDSVRIKLKGLRTTQDIRIMVHDAMCQLEELGVTHLRGVNLYVTPADAEGSPVMPRQYRKKITEITVEEPYRSIADEHKV